VQADKPNLRYRRVVVKLSGEALCGKEGISDAIVPSYW
jgi:hypothetical protein